jgi:hypothetical protein
MRRHATGQIWVVLMLGLGPLLAAASQIEVPKPKIINDPLTAEQVAVYHVVLENWTNGTSGTVNLANMTEPLEASDKACLKGTPDGSGSHGPIIHQLDSAQTLSTKFVLVDPDRQAEVIKGNDPQTLIMNAIDNHNAPSTKQLDDSVTRAFNTGLFTLSEILFDKQHRRAVVAYSFRCGMLCGHGNTLVLIRVGQTWKIRKTCGGWVS